MQHEVKAVGRCPKCDVREEYEDVETLFEDENVKVFLCVCLNCNSEFINYEVKVKKK